MRKFLSKYWLWVGLAGSAIIILAGFLIRTPASPDASLLAELKEFSEKLNLQETSTISITPAVSDSIQENKRINLNTASKEELMALPGIGETRAQAIINYREEHGGFKSIEELTKVSGIGEKIFEKVKGEVSI